MDDDLKLRSSVNVLSASELCKVMVKIVCFILLILCDFYHNKNILKEKNT